MCLPRVVLDIREGQLSKSAGRRAKSRCPNRFFPERGEFESTTDDLFLNVGFKHWKNWVDNKWGKMQHGLGRTTEKTSVCKSTVFAQARCLHQYSVCIGTVFEEARCLHARCLHACTKVSACMHKVSFFFFDAGVRESISLCKPSQQHLTQETESSGKWRQAPTHPRTGRFSQRDSAKAHAAAQARMEPSAMLLCRSEWSTSNLPNYPTCRMGRARSAPNAETSDVKRKASQLPRCLVKQLANEVQETLPHLRIVLMSEPHCKCGIAANPQTACGSKMRKRGTTKKQIGDPGPQGYDSIAPHGTPRWAGAEPAQILPCPK